MTDIPSFRKGRLIHIAEALGFPDDAAAMRARLAAEAAAVQHQRAQPFRSGIDGAGQARRSRAHDRGVIDLVGVDGAHHADAARQFAFTGIAQQLSTQAQHDGKLLRRHLETVHQRGGAAIGEGIQHAMGIAVAGEEIVQPQHVGMAGRADDHRPGGAGLQQSDAAQDQRPHQPLAQFGFLHQHVAQRLAGQDQGVDILRCLGIDQGRAVGQLRQLAQELAWAMLDDGFAAGNTAALADADAARAQENQPRPGFARRQDGCPHGIALPCAETFQPRHIVRRQHREHLAAAGFDGGRDDGHAAIPRKFRLTKARRRAPVQWGRVAVRFYGVPATDRAARGYPE